MHFHPRVLPSLSHVSSRPCVGVLFPSCRWESNVRGDRVTDPRSGGEAAKPGASCYPLLLTLLALLLPSLCPFVMQLCPFPRTCSFPGNPVDRRDPCCEAALFAPQDLTLQRRSGNPDCVRPQAAISEIAPTSARVVALHVGS